MAEAERTIGEMIKLAQELPDFSIIKSIPGIGDNLAARMIADSTKWFSKPPLMNTFYISSAIVLVLIIIVTKVILKKKNG